jgi:uncharacterized protein
MKPVTPERHEIRDFVESIELRAAAAGSKSPGTLSGYCSVAGKYSEDLGYFRETVAAGAFTKCLARCDVRCLKNHDPNLLLGRTSAGTLRLVQDEFGLKMECDLPDTTAGRDTAEEVRRGDMQGQSISFTTAIDQWDWSGDVPIRTVIEFDQLYDVGPVTFPAFADTSVACRAFQTETEKRSIPTPDAAAIAAALAATVATARDHDTARLRLLEVS